MIVGVRDIIPPVISHAHRDRLLAGGLRIRQTPVAPGVEADAHFTQDVDLLVHVLKGHLSTAEQVETSRGMIWLLLMWMNECTRRSNTNSQASSNGRGCTWRVTYSARQTT